MKHDNEGQKNFFSEISEHQISAKEFFCTVLLDSLNKNFGWRKAVISYFDTHGKFLSWTSWKGIMIDCKEHPYRHFAPKDIIRYQIYEDAVRDHLTYFNVTPRLYKATDIIEPYAYEHSEMVHFLEENFDGHYSMTLAFGINAYIQLSFLKSEEEGDFTEEETKQLEEIYVYVANAYKNFKKYEQAKIVADIQEEIIASGERAYLVTDDFMHIMSHNQQAQEYIADILGNEVVNQMSSSVPCSWLPFLLGTSGEGMPVDRVETRVIKDYIFKIYTYKQSYSNGIIDCYHWITISKKEEKKSLEFKSQDVTLTPMEQKVANLMYQGLTYRAIADKLVISYHTVKKHVQNIYTKCDVNSRYELYKWIESTNDL